MTIKYTTYFTALDGSEATITGDASAVNAIEDAFKKAGIKYNTQVECWDAGFYFIAPSNPYDSVECPHCHWGFASSVIDQHIREKH